MAVEKSFMKAIIEITEIAAGKRYKALPDVARRNHIKFLTQHPRRATIVSGGNNR